AAGDAVIFVHNLFHGSRTNRSGTERATAVVGVLRTDADRVAYWHPEGADVDRWRKLQVDDDYYNTGIAALAEGHLPPGATDLGEVRFTPLQPDELLAGLRRLHDGG
ncbi:hypothetical protein B7486_64130, partial [cyanobacterium TDX16]